MVSTHLFSVEEEMQSLPLLGWALPQKYPELCIDDAFVFMITQSQIFKFVLRRIMRNFVVHIFLFATIVE